MSRYRVVVVSSLRFIPRIYFRDDHLTVNTDYARVT